MKHFVTLAALLTSLSAFAQLPYNPDANNDGHIGAFDLTSLLSVYSGNFSNGLLGEGTQMASLTFFEDVCGLYYQFFIESDEANSWVIDLSLISPSDACYIGIEGGVSNGTTLTILRPSDVELSTMYVDVDSVDGENSWGELFFLNASSGLCAKMVFWNGEWLPLTPALSYYGFE